MGEMDKSILRVGGLAGLLAGVTPNSMMSPGEVV